MGRRGRRPHPDILTPREWEVLDLLRERLTNEQIAERLGITLDGAKYHVSEILSKLGVGTREQAAAWRAADLRPWWMRAISLPTAAAIGGAMTLIAAATGLTLLAWGVAETGGPSQSGNEPVLPQTAGPIQLTSSPSAEDCNDSTSVQLDDQPACSFSFEAVDVPARLQAFPLQVKPERTNTFGDILLYATCAPEDSCRDFATGEPATEERTSQLDWLIEEAATIMITSRAIVETDTIPAREYRLVDLAYDHPAERVCTAGFLYCYTFIANYERVK